MAQPLGLGLGLPENAANNNNNNNNAPAPVPTAHEDALRRIVQQEVRAEIHAAEDFIAGKAAKAVLNNTIVVIK